MPRSPSIGDRPLAWLSSSCRRRAIAWKYSVPSCRACESSFDGSSQDESPAWDHRPGASMDIEAWVDCARRNLLQRTDYPLIDSTEIDMDRALSEAWASEDSGATLLRSYTVTNPDDIAVRFVILNFLYRLVHWYDADDDDDVVEVE